MGKEKFLTYSPEQITAMIKDNPNKLYLEIVENGWMQLEHLKAVNADGMHSIYLIRQFYNRVKPREKSSKGQYKLL
jgi:hypothetical protein